MVQVIGLFVLGFVLLVLAPVVTVAEINTKHKWKEIIETGETVKGTVVRYWSSRPVFGQKSPVVRFEWKGKPVELTAGPSGMIKEYVKGETVYLKYLEKYPQTVIMSGTTMDGKQRMGWAYVVGGVLLVLAVVTLYGGFCELLSL